MGLPSQFFEKNGLDLIGCLAAAKKLFWVNGNHRGKFLCEWFLIFALLFFKAEAQIELIKNDFHSCIYFVYSMLLRCSVSSDNQFQTDTLLKSHPENGYALIRCNAGLPFARCQSIKTAFIFFHTISIKLFTSKGTNERDAHIFYDRYSIEYT